MVKKLLFIVVVLSFSGCCLEKIKTQEEIATIHVDPEVTARKVQLSDFASASLIVLPTSDSLLLNEINRIYLQDSSIYLADYSSLYRFAESGRCLGCISRQGTGPEDYMSISDFQIEGNQAWIMSRNNKRIGRYSWDNQQIACISKNLWMENIYISGDTMYIYTGNDRGGDNSFQIHSIVTAAPEGMNDFHRIDESKADYLFVKLKNVFQRLEGRNYFTQLFNDTVFSLTSRGCTPAFVVDFSGHNIPPSFFAGNYDSVMDFFQKLHKENRFAYGIDCFMNTDNGYWVGYFYKGQYHLSLVPKSKNGISPLCIGTILVDQLFNYPVNLSEVTLFVQDENRVVIPLEPSDVMDYARANLSEDELKIVTEKIHYTDDQNPILLVMRFCL